VLALTCLAPALAQPPAAPRVEVPIREVVLSNGVPRYGVPMMVGETPVLAGLDTGAAGLRLLPDVAKGAKAEAATESYAYATGTTLAGTRGRIRIGVGALSAEASAHLVTSTGCVKDRPGCPGSLGAGYGFLSHGLKGEGFRAMLGGNMGRTSIDHPLTVVGARRWIIELPRPGEGKDGRLILNPTDTEVAQFRTVRLAGQFREAEGGGLHDAVPGCVRNDANGERVCGLLTLDTGAYFIRVLNAGEFVRAPWAEGAPLTVEFRGEAGPPISTRMVVGREAQVVNFGAAPRSEVIVQLGTAPYFAHAVLYDPVRRRLGFKPRPGARDLPRGQLAEPR
jgi:hypothetical protein